MNTFIRAGLLALVALPMVALAEPDFGPMRNNHQVQDAPKAIPHPIDRFIPITKDTNYCAMCHVPAKTLKRTNPMETPITHFTKQGLDERRYVCTMCHMPAFTPEK